MLQYLFFITALYATVFKIMNNKKMTNRENNNETNYFYKLIENANISKTIKVMIF